MTSKRSASVCIGLTALGASVLTGCAAQQPDYQALCVDPGSEQRVPDEQCSDAEDPEDYDGTSGVGFFWFYMAASSRAPLPAIGSRYDPSVGTYRGRALVDGGRYVVRGGAPSAGASSARSYTTSTMRSGGFGGRGVSSS